MASLNQKEGSDGNFRITDFLLFLPALKQVVGWSMNDLSQTLVKISFS
jgi:hypothetical protein